MAAAAYRKKISLVRWVISTLILIPVLIIWTFFLTGHWKSFRVISRSMEPTLLVDDCLVMREQHNFPNLDNKIVVINDPQGGQVPLVKRVVACSSSLVRITNSRVYIDANKTPLPGEALVDTPNQRWQLTPDQIFVMGDNRNNSQDSTEFGPLNRSDVLGVITFRYWPLSRVGSVQ